MGWHPTAAAAASRPPPLIASRPLPPPLPPAAPQLLDGLLSHLADQIATYVRYQIDSGADCVQMFDSWGGQLPPALWDAWSRPYIERIVAAVKATHPATPLTLYVNGSGGLLERMAGTGVDVIGLDWTVDMADARARLGAGLAVQGNVDPVVLFGSDAAVGGGGARLPHQGRRPRPCAQPGAWRAGGHPRGERGPHV